METQKHKQEGKQRETEYKAQNRESNPFTSRSNDHAIAWLFPECSDSFRHSELYPIGKVRFVWRKDCF